MQYFSDKERGPKARTEDAIPSTVWGGIVATVQSLISSGAFGEHFPDVCPDGGTVGTNEQAFALGMMAEIPELEWPLKTTMANQEDVFSEEVPYSPEVMVILDLIQFCYLHVAKPMQVSFHKSPRNTIIYHLIQKRVEMNLRKRLIEYFQEMALVMN